MAWTLTSSTIQYMLMGWYRRSIKEWLWVLMRMATWRRMLGVWSLLEGSVKIFNVRLISFNKSFQLVWFELRLTVFQNRADTGGGGTIGPGLSEMLGCRAMDVGTPMLSMHSIRGITGSEDVRISVEFFEGFLRKYQSVREDFDWWCLYLLSLDYYVLLCYVLGGSTFSRGWLQPETAWKRVSIGFYAVMWWKQHVKDTSVTAVTRSVTPLTNNWPVLLTRILL